MTDSAYGQAHTQITQLKNSKWRNGKGDVVKEVAEALSQEWIEIWNLSVPPWDRNRKDYGTKSYIEYYRNQ